MSVGNVIAEGVVLAPISDGTTLDLPSVSKVFEGFGGGVTVNKTEVYFVNNLNESGAGSLAAAPANSYVVPLVSGDIVSATGINYTPDGTWFMGQASPGGIQVRGSSTASTAPLFQIRGSDTVFQHTRFRCSESTGANSSHKPLAILDSGAPVRNVVMDHCSMAFGDDDNGSVWYNTSGVSFLDCIFTHGLYNFQTNYGTTNGGGAGDISYYRCLFTDQDRNPNLQNMGTADLVNNVVYTSGIGPTLQSITVHATYVPAMEESKANFRKNVTMRVGGHSNDLAVGQRNENASYNVTAELFLEDNHGYNVGTGTYTPANVIMYGGGNDTSNPSDYFVGTPHVAPTPHVELDPQTALLTHVLANVGASHNRDSLDQAAIDLVNSGAAFVPSTTIADYGGYPTIQAATVADIFDATQIDGIRASIKVECGLPAASNTLNTFLNGGTSNDWLAIFDKYIGL